MRLVRDSRWVASALATVWLLVGAVAANAGPNPFDQTVKPAEIGNPLPAVSLVDQHGRRFTFSSLRGQAAVVGFIYTHCTDTCPIITQKFGRLDHLLGAGPYQLIEITIDPVHDSPAVIAAYARKNGVLSSRWHIATGNPAALESFVRAAGLAVVDNGRGELIHNARLLMLAPDGRLADVVELAAWDPSSVAAQLHHIAGAPSSPLARAEFALTKTVAQFCGGSYQVASGIIDVVAALLVITAGIIVLVWMRRRIFAQGA
ncbi:MAG: SCO family protein [Candidatus Eremiobacteraeota bacterium]|nr:SCO family protein [Candidatus Eremiobacteraeota bacterium]